MSKISTLKAYLKSQATKISTTKDAFKDHQREHAGYGGEYHRILWALISDYRHKHIAYCLLRGTPYERIEKPREGNEPDMAFTREIQNEYTENVCLGA